METVNKIKQMIADGVLTQEQAAKYFPELAESEERRIRKALIRYFTLSDEHAYKEACGVSYRDIVAWLEKQIEKEKFIKKELECIRGYRDEAIRRLNELEKQGEQNPLEWSEEDEYNVAFVVELLYGIEDSDKEYENKCRKMANWLKDLKGRYLPQLKQEWSEKDNEHIKSIISTIECSKARFPNSPAVLEAYNSDLNWLKSLNPQQKPEWSEEDNKKLNAVISLMRTSRAVDPFYDKMCLEGWLKSLRPRSNQEVDEQIETIAMHLDNCGNTAMAEILRSCNLRPQEQWKPSEEQIKALEDSIEFLGCTKKVREDLKSLYEQLKKLREKIVMKADAPEKKTNSYDKNR